MQLGSPYGVYDDLTDTYNIGTKMVERPLEATGYVNPLINTLGDYLYARENYGTNVVANGYMDIHPIAGLNFRLYDADEQIIAVISQKLLSIHDKYCVDIYKPEEEPVIVAILVTLQHMMADRAMFSSLTSSSSSGSSSSN